MNCANHAESPAVAYCRSCGKPLCSACSRDVRGVIYCEECLAAHISGAVPPGSTAVPPGVAPPPGTPNPRLAFILGWIPGVGAMYNGEFAKGFIHVLIFATLIWLANPDHGNGLSWPGGGGVRDLHADRGLQDGEGPRNGAARSGSARVEQSVPLNPAACRSSSGHGGGSDRPGSGSTASSGGRRSLVASAHRGDHPDWLGCAVLAGRAWSLAL